MFLNLSVEVLKPILQAKWSGEKFYHLICVYEWERTHLLFALPSNHMSDNLLANRILDGRTDPDTPKRIPITLSDTLVGKPILQAKWSGEIFYHLSNLPQQVNPFTHVNQCVCVWVRENSPPHLCLWVREKTYLPSTLPLPSNHTSDKSSSQ